jgi:hypothetical protein
MTMPSLGLSFVLFSTEAWIRVPSLRPEIGELLT